MALFELRTYDDCHREMEQARLAHLEADARWEDQMDRAGCPLTERFPTNDPAHLIIQTESQPRALPQAHGALRANDPQHPSTERTIVKKAPPSSGRPIPAGFIRGSVPPMIGAGVPMQPPPPVALPSTTPTTPANPPRPLSAALPESSTTGRVSLCTATTT